MIGSKERLEDMYLREQMLEIMKVCLHQFQRTGDQKYLEFSKEFGQLSYQLRKIINGGDYTKRDEIRNKIDNVINHKFIYETTKN